MSFNPATLFANGEVGTWYEPRDISTLFQDSDGNTPVTADGQPVGKMLDKSGNGNHASQSVASKRPTYRDVDGVQWLEFDGADDSMSVVSFDMSSTDKMGLFTALQPSSTGGTKCITELGNSSGTLGGFYLFQTNNIIQYSGRGSRKASNNDLTNTNTPSTTNPSIVTAQLNINDGLPTTVRRNGTQEDTSSSTTFGGGNFRNLDLYIGDRTSSGFRYQGRIHGIIIRGDESTSQEVTDTEEYLTALTVPPLPLLPSKLLNSNNLSTTNINAIYSLSLESITCSNIIDGVQLFKKFTLETSDLNSQNKLSTTSILTNYPLSLDGISNTNLLDQTLLSVFYSVTVDKISSGQRVDTAIIPVSLFLDSIFQASSTTNSLLRYIPKIGNYKISFSKTLSPNMLNVNITKIEYGIPAINITKIEYGE